MSDNNLSKICKNCGKNFTGNYCNFCGQSSDTHKINFHYVIHEIQHSIFHFDGGIFYTMKELIKRPGNSIREFIEGKRVNHFKPVTYVIILSIIHSFLEHSGKRKPFIEDFLLGVLQSIKQNGKVLKSNGNFSILEWLIHHYAYTALLLIPIFSLAALISFRKSKFNYFEHLVLNAYTFGQITLIFILSFPLSYLFKHDENFEYFKILLSVAYTFWVFYHFFNDLKKNYRIINTIMTYCLFLIFFYILILLIFTTTLL